MRLPAIRCNGTAPWTGERGGGRGGRTCTPFLRASAGRPVVARSAPSGYIASSAASHSSALAFSLKVCNQMESSWTSAAFLSCKVNPVARPIRSTAAAAPQPTTNILQAGHACRTYGHCEGLCVTGRSHTALFSVCSGDLYVHTGKTECAPPCRRRAPSAAEGGTAHRVAAEPSPARQGVPLQRPARGRAPAPPAAWPSCPATPRRRQASAPSGCNRQLSRFACRKTSQSLIAIDLWTICAYISGGRSRYLDLLSRHLLRLSYTGLKSLSWASVVHSKTRAANA